MAEIEDCAESRTVQQFLRERTEDSFSPVFQLIYPQMRRYFLVRGFACEIAEELAQDVLVSVYRKASTVRDLALFRPWLFKVAQNTLRQHLRRTRHAPEIKPIEEAAVAERTLENAGFLDLISLLPEDQQQVMRLRYIEELTYEEIAAVLDLPLGTVKWKIFDSKSRIQAHARQQAAGRI